LKFKNLKFKIQKNSNLNSELANLNQLRYYVNGSVTVETKIDLELPSTKAEYSFVTCHKAMQKNNIRQELLFGSGAGWTVVLL